MIGYAWRSMVQRKDDDADNDDGDDDADDDHMCMCACGVLNTFCFVTT